VVCVVADVLVIEIRVVLGVVAVVEMKVAVAEIEVVLVVDSVTVKVRVTLCVVAVVVFVVTVLRVVVGNKHVGMSPSKESDAPHANVITSPSNGALQLTLQLSSSKVPVQSSVYSTPVGTPELQVPFTHWGMGPVSESSPSAPSAHDRTTAWPIHPCWQTAAQVEP
jgi:hypothetical protein